MATLAQLQMLTDERVKELCNDCGAKCCRYFALQIDEPEDWEDFDDLRWYLAHELVSVYVEDGEWFLNVGTVCKHLGAANECTIYERRPQICRDYHIGECENTQDPFDWELFFGGPEDLEAYCRKEYGWRFDAHEAAHGDHVPPLRAGLIGPHVTLKPRRRRAGRRRKAGKGHKRVKASGPSGARAAGRNGSGSAVAGSLNGRKGAGAAGRSGRNGKRPAGRRPA